MENSEEEGHPRSMLDRLGDNEEALGAFFQLPLERDWFDAWITYLAEIFEYTPSAERVRGLYTALVDNGFTNAEMSLSGDWVVANCERFPVASHFISSPALSKNRMPYFADKQ